MIFLQSTILPDQARHLLQLAAKTEPRSQRERAIEATTATVKKMYPQYFKEEAKCESR